MSGSTFSQSVFTDPRFGWAVLRSLVFAGGSTIGCFVLGFLLAYLIYRPFRGQALYYALFILPMLTVPIVISYTGADAARPQRSAQRYPVAAERP